MPTPEISKVIGEYKNRLHHRITILSTADLSDWHAWKLSSSPAKFVLAFFFFFRRTLVLIANQSTAPERGLKIVFSVKSEI